MKPNLVVKSNRIKFVAIVFVVSIDLAIIYAQETKGGSFFSSNSLSSSQTKGGGGGTSSFRQSIESFKRQQQATINPQPVSQTDFVKESVSSFSSAVQRPETLNQQSISIEEQQQQQQNSVTQSEPALYGGVAGTPGIDFPNYVTIPNTRFKCDGLPYQPGMYADESTGCQLYHLCYEGRMESFLCGIGTVFNQAIMNCDFWHSVDCSKSSQYYSLNADFGKSLGEPATSRQSKTSSRIESSSFVQVQRPPPPVVTSSFVSRQQSSSTAVNRPVLINNNNNAIQSSSEFSSSRLSSQPQPFVGTGGDGKTSFRREEQNFRGSGGLLSPSRQRQQFNLDGQSGQFTSESSTQIKVMPSTDSKNSVESVDDHSSVDVGSSLVVADDRAPKQQQQSVLEKTPFGKASPSRKTSSPVSGASSATGKDDGGWKVYFKSKTNNSKTAGSASTTIATPTSTTASTTTPNPPPAEPVTATRPDQEPVFSQQAKTTTTEGPASSVSIEPDVGSAVAATETPSIPSADPVTTSGATAEPETPGKSGAPPPTEAPNSKGPVPTTTTATPATFTEAPSSTSTTVADSSTVGQADTSTTTASAAEKEETTATTAAKTDSSSSSSSSVEYAGDDSGGSEKTEESKKRAAAARKRKALT